MSDPQVGGKVPIDHEGPIGPAPSGGSVPASSEQNFHVPQIAQRSDGRWGVFCAACSAQASDYVYPCPQWADGEYPAILLEKP